MEIRCSQCQHVGPAADVVQSSEGILFVCANCGHENPVSLGPSKPGSAADAESTGADGARDVLGAPPTEPRPRPEWLDDVRAKLIPERGDGLRCPKCLSLLPYDETICPRCGLDVEKARGYGPGEAPWERPPAGKEALWEQANLLWASATEGDGTTDDLEKFVAFVRDEGLTELGVRRLREYLVDHPDDERAVEWLEEIAATFQARIMVARARAEVSAEQFSESTERLKRGMVVATAAFLFVFLTLSLAYFLL